MATEKLFEVIQSDSILVLTLNRPKALNALNKQLIGELHHFFVKELKTYPKDEKNTVSQKLVEINEPCNFLMTSRFKIFEMSEKNDRLRRPYYSIC